MNKFKMRAGALSLVFGVALAGAGCGDDGNDPGNETGDPVGVESGSYGVGVAFEPLSGLVLPFKLDIDVAEDGLSILSAKLYPVGGGQVGELAAEVTDVVREEGQPLTVDFPLSTLPGAFSPTGSDVTFDITFTLDDSADIVCGDVTGVLPSVGDLDVAGSTFGAATWVDADTAPPSACTEEEVVECERMEASECPTLVSGENTGFMSCGIERSFELLLPVDDNPPPKGIVEPSTYPLVFSWHGLGGSAEGYGPSTGFEAGEGAYFILPDGRGLDGTEYSQTTTNDGEDLAFFDDLVTCATDQLDVNEDRIHSEGMSAGGLFSTYLGVMRPDVLASVTPFSGGLIIDYPNPDPAIPILISWGGEDDNAVGQNFDTFADDLIADALAAGHVVVACDHGEGHVRRPEWGNYALQFMIDHPKGTTDSPYDTDGLPEVFPDFCELRMPEVPE